MSRDEFCAREFKKEYNNISRKRATEKATDILRNMVEADKKLPYDLKRRYLLLNVLATFSGVGLTVKGIRQNSINDVNFGLFLGTIGAFGLTYTLKIINSSKNSDNKNE